MSDGKYSLQDLLRVMERLRDPDHGCPWDLDQTFETIVPSTLEECYELAHAIEQGDFEHVHEELGDVLFQVIFYAQLGREQGLFTFADVVHTLVGKLLRRHPHVFRGGQIEGVVQERVSTEDVKLSWEDIKRGERAARNKNGVLADVPLALPALPRAQKLQKRAAQVGFDWPDSAPVLDKLREEFDELNAAIASGDHLAMRDEIGDLLFTCVNLARHLGLNAEEALRCSSRKFEGRFRHMEAASNGRSLAAVSAEELDQLWRQAKESTP